MIEFKVSDFFYPRELIRTYLLLRRSEYWTNEQFEKYQSALLSRLLNFSAKQVPYYSSVFEEAGLDVRKVTPANALFYLRHLPVLDKDVVLEKSDSFIAQDTACFRPKPITTSGTTGTPLTVYWDRGSNVMEICSIQRLWRWAGFRIGQAFLDLRSRMFTSEDNHVVKNGGLIYIYNWKVNGLEFSSDLIDDGNIQRYYEVLLRYKPRLIRGHPQSIQHLALLIQKKGLRGWRPTVVTTASETLYEFQRKDIEQAWQVPVLDSYGLKEHNVFIAQCLEGGYHIFPEYGICEILDGDGIPVKPGQEGWIIATGLHNYAQVLLRYNTRDRAIAGDGRLCPCGRSLPLVECIIGRIDDCVYTAEGRQYSGMHFAFFGRRGIRKARLIQTDLSTVKVELVVTPQFNITERTALTNALKQKVNDKLSFELQIVDDIVQQTSGKFKFVISNVKKR